MIMLAVPTVECQLDAYLGNGKMILRLFLYCMQNLKCELSIVIKL